MKRIISLALCFLLTFTLCQPVFALKELEWTGAADDGSWHNAANWNPAQVPEDGGYVIIPESSVVEYVYGETSVRLNCAGNLTVSGGTLKMSNPSLSENSSLTNGKLDGAGDITIPNGSSFVWSGGNIEGTGKLIIEDEANLYAKASASLDRYLVNNGSLLITDSLRLTCGAEGSGNFNIQEDQTLELGGSGSYNLSSNFNNFGTLKILNTCSAAQFNSGYTQQKTGTLEFDIGGTSEFTTLEVTGTALLNGKLKINILDGYGPIPGDTFEIMTYSARVGTFSSIESNLPEITFEATYTDTGLTLTVNDGTVSGGYLCKVGEVGYDTLDGALEAVMYGGTIQLLGNIDYDGGLFVDGAEITFDLNGYTLNVNSSTYSVPGVGLEVKNGGNVFLIGSGQFNVRQISDGTCYGVKVSDASTAMVTNIQVTLLDDGSAFGAYADGTGSSIHVLGNVHVTGEGGCGARTLGRGRITVDGTIAAMAYINIGYTNKDKSSGVDDPEKPGYLKYCTEPVTGIVWVKASPVVVPTVPQNFIATPGDGQVALSWTAPASDGGAVISHYEVSADDGTTWVTASTSISHTFTGLTNSTEYTFKVRAVNSEGPGAEARATATPIAPAQTTHTVNFYSNSSLYTSKTVTSGSTLGSNWPKNPTRSGYSFGGWFTGQNGAGTQYTSTTIITADVDLYAKWTYNGDSGDSGGSGGGGGSSTPTTPTLPVYKAIVKTESGTEKTLLIRVNRDTGTASLGEDPWHERPKGRTVINMPSIPGVGIYSVGIPVSDLSTSDVLGTVTINTGSGSITVPSNMLTGVADADGNKAQISIGQGDKSTLPKNIKSAIGDRPLVQLTLSIDGKMIGWSNPNAPVTVSIPYTPTSAELANPENIVVWYIDTSGNIVTIPNGHFDPATGMVTFYTTHFNNYAVAYNKVSFNDVTADAWYHKAVSFIAARAITSGTGGGNFSPEAKLTRGQFIVMLMKAYGIAPDANPKDNFADAGATYYTGYLAAAKRLGISNGIGNNMFAPDKEITRQEMFTLLCNALKIIGRLPEGTSGKPLSAFADAGDIASWAKEAMTLLVERGTIEGYDGKLYPLSISTRAEMAQVLYNMLSK